MTNSLITGNAPQTDALHFPCTTSQRRYIAIDRHDPGRLCLNSAFCYRIEGVLRDSVIERAFRALLQRHEIFRTRFVEHADGWQQEIVDDVPAKVSIIDLTQLKPEMAEREAEAIGKLEVSKPFDLATAPLLRLTVLKLSRNASILLITAHATVIDGWSISIIVDEIGRYIEAFDADAQPALPAVEMQFGDYARWQQEMITTGSYDDQLRYWNATLAGMPGFRVPAPQPATQVPTHASLIRGTILSRDLTGGMENYAKSHGHTFFSLGVASLAVMLQARTGAGEIAIGTQVSGREHQETEGIVGPLLNAVVLRLPTPPGSPMADLVAATSATTVEALTHQSVPFECVVGQIAPEQADQRHPLCSVNFALQSAFIHDNNSGTKKYGRFEIISMPSQSASPIWDLNFALVERPIGWRMSCEANTDLFDANTVDTMLAEWQSAMATILSAPGARLSGAQAGSAEVATGRSTRHENPISRSPETEHAAARPAVSAPGAKIKTAFDDGRILLLQSAGEGVPIMGLNVTSFYHNFAALDRGRRFYDIQLPSAEQPKRIVPRAMSDLAADSVRLIRSIQPHGPYIIMGLCMIGAVAMEAAHQLRAEGEEVPLVVLNDTWAPGFREDMSRWNKVVRQLQHRQYNLRLDLAAVRRQEISLGEAIERTGIYNLLSGRSLSGDRSMRELDVMTEGYSNGWFLTQILWSYAHHRPEPYPGRVVHFRTSEIPSGRLFEREFGWKDIVTGGYDVFDIPGGHAQAMSEPAISIIAEKLQPILSSIDEHYGLGASRNKKRI